jgi:hypothetical protein
MEPTARLTVVEQHWSQSEVGLVTTLSGLLGIAGRSPALARASGDHPGNVPRIGVPGLVSPDWLLNRRLPGSLPGAAPAGPGGRQ